MCTKTATIFPKSPNGEYVTVVWVIEEKGAVEASHMFLPSKCKHSKKTDGPWIIKDQHTTLIYRIMIVHAFRTTGYL